MWQRLVSELPEFLGYYNLIFLGKAALATVTLSAAGSATGIVAGFALAVLRQTKTWFLAPLRWLTVAFIEFFRRVPFLVTLMLVFLAVQHSGIDAPVFVVALITVFLVATAYLAEIVRAGFESVHRNQWDAAATMN
ncbi:MAG: ABC transporter permease subunit, partial [Candidatus Binatia bacterium]